MTSRLRKLLGTLVLFLLGFGVTVAVLMVAKKLRNRSGSNPSVDLANVPGISIGEEVDLPDLSTIKGETVSLKEYRGKYRLCVIFSTECPGCAKDSEMWKDLSAEASKRQIDFDVISIDDDRLRVERFAKAYGFDDLHVLFDPQKKLARILKISFVPQYLLLTPKGKVMGRWNGVQYYDANKHETWRLDHFFKPVGSE